MKILLVGESCLDKTLTCVHERMSPEDPSAPVYRVLRDSAEEGMVQVVSKALWAFSTPHEVLTNRFTDAIVKTRVMVNDKQVVRVDEDVHVELASFEVDWLKKNASTFDAIVVSDYGKGLLSKEVIDVICESGARVYLDPHPNNPIEQYKNVFCVKLNIKELRLFLESWGSRLLTDGQIVDSGTAELKHRIGAQHVIVTRGELGASVIDPTGNCLLFRHPVSQVKNVSGAGDVVLASIVSDMEGGLLDVHQVMGNAMKRVGKYVSGSGL